MPKRGLDDLNKDHNIVFGMLVAAGTCAVGAIGGAIKLLFNNDNLIEENNKLRDENFKLKSDDVKLKNDVKEYNKKSWFHRATNKVPLDDDDDI